MRLLLITQTVDKNHTNLGFFHEWLVKLAARVETLTVICLGVGEYSLPSNVTVLSLGKEQGKSRIVYLWRLFSYLVRYRSRYDRVFVHMNGEYIVLSGWWWWLTKKPIFLWYVHQSVTWKLRWAERFVERIFTASAESCRAPSQKIQIVGHGIDIARFTTPMNTRPSVTQGIRLLSVGRITPRKGVLVYLQALDFLQKVAPGRFFLDIVGEAIQPVDFEYQAQLETFTREQGLQKQVTFLGGVKYADLPALYQSRHALLHASQTGSIDKVVLEALASGLTVFSSSDAYAQWPDFIIKFKVGDGAELGAAIQKANEGVGFVPSDVGRQYVADRFSLDHLIGTLVSIMQK